MMRLACGVVIGLVGGWGASQAGKAAARGSAPLELGNFSVSLTVKDAAKSLAFYEKLGFRKILGDPTKRWVILQNATCTIGLFQGLFERNTLTFNPGWDRTCATLPAFEDVRELQRRLQEGGVALDTTANAASSGPASFSLTDPDGNPILVDQHVPRPSK